MSAKERAALITKLHRVAKKKYSQEKPPTGRTLLEHVVYACCLEDSSYEAADEAFARLQADYYDWNEVRVTTVAELAEACKGLQFPMEAATRIRKALHGIFETYYSFDIDALKKENLGKTTEQFQKFRGVTPFVVSYVAQHGLGGHSIPLDQSLLNLLYMIGAITETEREKEKVPGLERTIPKNKGVEFASVTHQLAAAFTASPFNKDLRSVVLSVSGSAQERFPKRGGRKKAAAAAESPKPKKKPSASEASVKQPEPKKPDPKKAPATATTPVKKKPPAKQGTSKKAAAKKPAAKKTTVKKPAAKKKATAKSTPKKAAKKTTKKSTSKKSPTKRLARKKPR